MMQAHARTEALERRLQDERRRLGIEPQQRRRIRELQQEHRRASDEYQRLRELYLEAEKPSARVPPPAALAFDTKRFELPLAHLLRESRFERLASPDLHRFVDVDRRFARAITAPYDRTLGSLATADHRTLTHPHVAELRRHIARLDGIVERLKDAPPATQI